MGKDTKQQSGVKKTTASAKKNTNTKTKITGSEEGADTNYSHLTVIQLKAELSRRKLKTSGIKEDFVDRLIADDKSREPKRTVVYKGSVVDIDDRGNVFDNTTGDPVGDLVGGKLKLCNTFVIVPYSKRHQIVVTRHSHKGKDYLLHKSTGYLYDFNSSHCVGTYDSTTKKTRFLNSLPSIL
uniref:SAP domain-containing protein n=1 Tax=viral metagenome TaxID=1070528 RepID=A0A6C0DLK5_9ZZZZ